jgi:hypothetical protein
LSSDGTVSCYSIVLKVGGDDNVIIFDVHVDFGAYRVTPVVSVFFASAVGASFPEMAVGECVQRLF